MAKQPKTTWYLIDTKSVPTEKFFYSPDPSGREYVSLHSTDVKWQFSVSWNGSIDKKMAIKVLNAYIKAAIENEGKAQKTIEV